MEAAKTAVEAHVTRGTASIYYAYDIGSEVRIAEASDAFFAGSERVPQPAGTETERGVFKFDVLPLSKNVAVEPVKLGERGINATATVTVFDSGAASVRFTLPLDGILLTELVSLSPQLYKWPELKQAADALVASVLGQIQNWVAEPKIADDFEDYVFFDLVELALPEGRTLRSCRMEFAQILLGEDKRLSASLVKKTLSSKTSYHPGDVAVFGWRGAIAVGEDWDDVGAIVENANAELLQLKIVRQIVKCVLEDKRCKLQRSQFLSFGRFTYWNSLVEVQVLKQSIRVQLERIDNPLNLIGDSFLAETYQAVSERMGIPDEESEVEKLVGDLDDLEGSIAERGAALRTDLVAVFTFIVGLMIGEFDALKEIAGYVRGLFGF